MLDHRQGRRLVVELLAHLLTDYHPLLSAAMRAKAAIGVQDDFIHLRPLTGQVPGQVLTAVPFATRSRRLTRVSRRGRRYLTTLWRLVEQQQLVGVKTLGPRAIEPVE